MLLKILIFPSTLSPHGLCRPGRLHRLRAYNYAPDLGPPSQEVFKNVLNLYMRFSLKLYGGYAARIPRIHSSTLKQIVVGAEMLETTCQIRLCHISTRVLFFCTSQLSHRAWHSTLPGYTEDSTRRASNLQELHTLNLVMPATD